MRTNTKSIKIDYLENKLTLSPLAFVTYIEELKSTLSNYSYRKVIKFIISVNMHESHKLRKQSKEYYLKHF